MPCDALFPLAYCGIVMRMSNLDALRSRRRAAWMLATSMLTSTTSAVLGFAVGAIVPRQEMAMSVGPVLIVLSIMMADTRLAFSGEADPSASGGGGLLPALRGLSMIKWGFEGAIHAEFAGNPMMNGHEGGAARGAAARLSDLVSRGGGARGGACVGDEVLAGLGLRHGPMACARRQLAMNLALIGITHAALSSHAAGRRGAAAGIPVVYRY